MTPKTIVVWKMFDLVKMLFPEIKRMWYMIDAETKEEFVVVEYKKRVYSTGTGGSVYFKTIEGSFQICVTCDSNSAMVDDVWKKLKERFG